MSDVSLESYCKCTAQKKENEAIGRAFIMASTIGDEQINIEKKPEVKIVFII